jgi:hypothetical protein
MARPAIRREEAILDAPENNIAVPAPAAAAFRPKRQIEKQNEGRKHKVYSVISGGGIWFKLNQNNVTIYDPIKDTVRAIRYCPNEPSIYTDEQSVNAMRDHIVFRDGYLAVAANKPNLQAYLDAHPDNKVNGGNVFFAVDTSKKAEEDLDKEFLLHDAISLVRDKSIDELLPVAMYLGINIEQRNQEIRRELLTEAKVNPKAFIEMFDNPMVKIRSAIRQAIDFQLLRERPDGIYWFDTNRLIITAPAGQDPSDVLTRYCMTEKGAPIYDEVLNRLERLG